MCRRLPASVDAALLLAAALFALATLQVPRLGSGVAVWSEPYDAVALDDQHHLHRLALKKEAVRDLLTGWLSLADTRERFCLLGAGSDDEADQQIADFARILAGSDPFIAPAASTLIEQLGLSSDPSRCRTTLSHAESSEGIAQ